MDKVIEKKATPKPLLVQFVNFINKAEGRDKFGKIIQFWVRAASYFTRNVRCSLDLH